MRKEHISLWTFKNIIKQCWKNTEGAKGARVIFILHTKGGEKEYKVKSIGQFGVIPDVEIDLEEVK